MCAEKKLLEYLDKILYISKRELFIPDFFTRQRIIWNNFQMGENKQKYCSILNWIIRAYNSDAEKVSDAENSTLGKISLMSIFVFVLHINRYLHFQTKFFKSKGYNELFDEFNVTRTLSM